MGLREELIEALREPRNVVLVVGSGVSSATTNGDARASWVGLIRDGLQRCAELDLGFRQTLLQSYLDKLDGHSHDVTELLSCATAVQERLQGRKGQWPQWLTKSVGALAPAEPAMIECIGRIADGRVATTNYDTLLSDVLGHPAVSWRDELQVSALARDRGKGILHLHGHHKSPESVVLGYRSYADLLNNAAAQAHLRALLLTKTLVFIGAGDGMADPNFGALLHWFNDTVQDGGPPHYCLVRREDLDRLQKQSVPVTPIEYGTKHADLLPYLCKLENDVTARVRPRRSLPAPRSMRPPPHAAGAMDKPKAPKGGRSISPKARPAQRASELAFINEFSEYCRLCTDMIERSISEVRTMQTPSQVDGDSTPPFGKYMKATARRIVRQADATGLTTYKRLVAVDAACFEQEKRKLGLFFDELSRAIEASGDGVSVNCLAIGIVHREEMAQFFHSNLDVHITASNECALAFHLGEQKSSNYWQTCLYARLDTNEAAHRLISSFDAIWRRATVISANEFPDAARQLRNIEKETVRALQRAAFREQTSERQDTMVSLVIQQSKAFSNSFFARARNHDPRRGSLEPLVSEWFAITRAFAFCATKYVARLASECYEGDAFRTNQLSRALQIASAISAGEFGLGNWGSGRNGIHYQMFATLGGRTGVPLHQLEKNARGTWPETGRVLELFEKHLDHRLGGAGVLCTIEQTAYHIVDAMHSLFPGESEYIALHLEIETAHAALAGELCNSVKFSDAEETEIVAAASELCDALGAFWGRMAVAVFDGTPN